MWQLTTLPLILQAIVLTTSTSETHTVWPDPPSHCKEQPCLTFDLHVEQTDFTSGHVTLLFQTGNHSAHTGLHLEGVSNITLSAEEGGAILVMSNSSTISCENVTDFKLKGLTLVFDFGHNEHNEISALEFQYCDSVIIENCTFLGREQTQARAIFSIKTAITITHCLFLNNTAVEGGAIYSSGSRLELSGNSFLNNLATLTGGAIQATDDSKLVLNANNTFNGNRAQQTGGVMYLIQSNLLVSAGGHTISGGTTTFTSNKAELAGAVYLLFSTATFERARITFHNNVADVGGGLVLESSDFHTNNNQLVFSENVANSYASAVLIRANATDKVTLRGVVLTASLVKNRGRCTVEVWYTQNIQVTFKHLHIQDSIGSAVCIYGSAVNFTRNTTISNCSTQQSGGGVYASNSKVTFVGTTLFSNNTALNGGAIYSLYGKLKLFAQDKKAVFTQNTAQRNGGALYTLGTAVRAIGNLSFTSNMASKGGAMYFRPPSIFTLMFPIQLNASSNIAGRYGGVIYHEDTPTPAQCSTVEIESMKSDQLSELPYCFLQLEKGEMLLNLTSKNNTAGENGQFLYGGLLDKCQIQSTSQSPSTAKRTILHSYYTRMDNHSPTKEQARQNITSLPYLLSFCVYSDSNTYAQVRNVEVFRGQKFIVSLYAHAQLNTFTSANVTALTSNTASLEREQASQTLPSHCSNLTYSLYSTQQQEQITLHPHGPCHDTGVAKATINVTLLPCPKPFAQDGHRCACEHRLHPYDIECIINEHAYLSIKDGSQLWIGLEQSNNNSSILILYQSCPVQYCKTGAVNLTLEDLDEQCDHNHMGLLCGACATNYSLMLGSSQCGVCSSEYLALVVPMAAAGVLLVGFLTCTKLTVATGTLNSIILYSNIVQANKIIFFPENTVNILTVFIAWMNLDLGFRTCFYDGMDAYVQTWLQFVFPVYIWILISLIILSSRYSITVSKLIGSNPIAVLATLLLMSYTKILKIIIEVYSSVELDYPDNKTVTVWLKDANVPYLHSKHLFLAVVTSLVFIFFFLPYTLLLLLGYKLYRFSGRKHFRWFNRIKPLLDAYYAPYRTQSRYWTGFLLLVRCALYIVFSFDNSPQRTASLLAIILTFSITNLAILLTAKKIYRECFAGCLEPLVSLNLIAVSSLTLAKVHHLSALVYTLVGLVCMATVIVTAHQLFLQHVSTSTRWLKFKTTLCAHWAARQSNAESATGAATQALQDPPEKSVSTTIVELREPLLL